MTLNAPVPSSFTRRRLLVGGLTGLAATLAAPLLAACGGAPPSPTAAPAVKATTVPTGAAAKLQATAGVAPAAATTTAAGQGSYRYTYAPKTDKTRERMAVGIQGLPSGLDPANELGNVGTRVYYSIYDTLLRRDFFDNNKLKPALATAWKRTSDTVMEITLRQGVVFHNGDPMTAEDVKYTFDRFLKPDTAFVEARGYFINVQEVQVIDPQTIRFITKQPDPLLEQRLASWASWIVPKNHIQKIGGDKEFALKPVGTGPFKVAKFSADTELVLERHEGYWEEKPPLKQLTYRIIPENAARVTALLNDEVQIITNIPPDQVKTLTDSPNVEVRDVPLANMHVLRYNTKHAVLKSDKLRTAMNLGINRKLLVDTLWNGRAVLTRGHQFDEYGPLYNANRPYLPFDPEKAKALVAESGYKGETITYRTQGDYYTNGMAAGQAIISMWKDIGLKAEIMLVTAGDKEDPATSMVANWSNSSVLADPDGAFWRTWGKETSVQKNYWTPDSEFNKLGEEARTILDAKKRYENYQKMYDIWEREAPGTVLYIPVENYGVSKDVNWSPYPFYYADFRAYNLSFNK